MFENTFAAELATRLGSRIEVATSENLVEGLLISVNSNLITIDTTNGYGSGNRLYISIDSINYVRFPATAA
ncbi:hypothetical protein [Salibacterium halotolerans]|uniref:DUF2642 domain-containing protein n=1 Tax=Salibacterium halotolerans TaxID=1884432 RepID=A0A1I5XIK3_9BACI|nr:hypothetical protein [Salibacterium halotolerans]SFQ31792.1 hypothetical protein SAMN05518683_12832 [Salibacterium halotolerans]